MNFRHAVRMPVGAVEFTFAELLDLGSEAMPDLDRRLDAVLQDRDRLVRSGLMIIGQ